VVLVLMALPWHLFMATLRDPGAARSTWMYPVVLCGLAAGLVGGAMTVLLSLRLGVEALRKVEF
jgi:hypothetical protein